MKVLVNNKKALYNYEVIDKYEAGISLYGWEVKSIRDGRASLKDAFIRLSNGEVWMTGANISKWKTQARDAKVETLRERKLLLHKEEIKKIFQKAQTKGTTIVPLQLYLSDKNRIKVEIGVVRGKKQHDKRQKIKEKDMKRDLEQQIKSKDIERW